MGDLHKLRIIVLSNYRGECQQQTTELRTGPPLKESEKELEELEGARDPLWTTMPSNQSFQGLSHYLKTIHGLTLDSDLIGSNEYPSKSNSGRGSPGSCPRLSPQWTWLLEGRVNGGRGVRGGGWGGDHPYRRGGIGVRGMLAWKPGKGITFEM